MKTEKAWEGKINESAIFQADNLQKSKYYYNGKHRTQNFCVLHQTMAKDGEFHSNGFQQPIEIRLGTRRERERTLQISIVVSARLVTRALRLLFVVELEGKTCTITDNNSTSPRNPLGHVQFNTSETLHLSGQLADCSISWRDQTLKPHTILPLTIASTQSIHQWCIPHSKVSRIENPLQS